MDCADQRQPHVEPLGQTETGLSHAHAPHLQSRHARAQIHAGEGTDCYLRDRYEWNVAVCSRLVVLKAETLDRLWEQSVKEKSIAGLGF